MVGTTKKVTWSSSKSSVASVSSKGKVTSKSKGTATITAKVGTKTYTCKVVVKSRTYEEPSYSVFLSSKTNYSCSIVPAIVTNNGSKSMKVYSEGSMLLNTDIESTNRLLNLIDTEELINENNVEYIDYVYIKPGESKTVGFVVKGDDTYYDDESFLCFLFDYDGNRYLNLASSYHGTVYELYE